MSKKLCRSLALALAVLMMIFVMAACGPNTTSSPSPVSSPSPTASPSPSPADTSTPSASPTDNATPVKITMATWWGGAGQTALQAVLDAYTAAHPNVTFELTVWPWDQYPDKIATALAGGTLPDLMMVDSSSFMQGFYNSGAIQSLNSLIASTNYDTSTWLPGIQTTCSIGSDIVAVPLHYDQMVTWYNADLFKQAGIANLSNNPTWTDVQNAAKAVAALGKDSSGNPIYGLELGNSSIPWLYLAQKGISAQGSDGSFQMNNDTVISAFQEVQTMLNASGGVPAGLATDPFTTGNVGVAVVWVGATGAGSGFSFDTRVVNAPVMDASGGSYILQTINGISMSATTKNAAVAMDVMAFFTSDASIASLANAAGITPPVTGSAHDAYLQVKTTFPYDAAQVVAGQANSTAVALPSAKWFSPVQSAIVTNWPAFVGNTMTAQAFVTSLQTAYDQWNNTQS